MGFIIVREDITKVKADAIVNSANPKPICGGSMDYAVFLAAGMEKLLKAREGIGEIARGQAAATPAFALSSNNVKYIIHTVGPIWEGGDKNELQLLRACYDNSLQLALKLKCKSIAFPLISTGTYRFPKDKALNVALAAIQEFLLQHNMKIILVVFDDRSFELSSKLVDDIREYVDENYVADSRAKAHEYYELRKQQDPNFAYEEVLEKIESNYAYAEDEKCDHGSNIKQSDFFEISSPPIYKSLSSPKKSLKAKPASKKLKEMDGIIIEPLEKTFQERILEIMDEKNLTAPEVYNRASVTKQVFSKMLSNKYYKPHKGTALTFCLSLKLSVEETNDLIGRAGYVLSPSNLVDMVVKACIRKKIYNPVIVDGILFDYKCPQLKTVK